MEKKQLVFDLVHTHGPYEDYETEIEGKLVRLTIPVDFGKPYLSFYDDPED
jgi:hypothetical protein